MKQYDATGESSFEMTYSKEVDIQKVEEALKILESKCVVQTYEKLPDANEGVTFRLFLCGREKWKY